jgi:hypothetical protein
MTQTEVSRWGHFLACATDPVAEACAGFATLRSQRTRIVMAAPEVSVRRGKRWRGFETMAMMRKGQVRKIDGLTSAAKPPLSPTCSTGPHERSEPAHHLRASLVNIVATEPPISV